MDRLLKRAAADAHGLMSAPVYRRLYETAAHCGGDTIVEVGTFRGAATLALALGAQAAGLPFRLLTADLLRLGVGARGATLEERIAELSDRFTRFGVSQAVRFVHGSSADLAAQCDPRDIHLLLLDGGGRIEQDLALLWERMTPGCIIVIDDVDDLTIVRRGWRTATVDQKHRLSKALVDRFTDAGLLVPVGQVGITGWYKRGIAVVTAAEIEHMALPAYHALVKTEVTASQFGLARALLRWMARRAPAAARSWRRLRPPAAPRFMSRGAGKG
ncbi:MAG: Methyltransferase domain [Sphingomonadales bacterium]|nr:Methyltransferase domain [Sphingomonadales bacterium]